MTPSLAEACADLAQWLPAIAELVAEPDTEGTRTHGQPHSTPPWNAAAANAVYDVHAEARQIEATLRFAVTGTVRVRGGSDANTLLAIAAIEKLSDAADQTAVHEAASLLSRLLTQILQLPAVDLEERPQRIAAACPYCQRPMLRLYPRDGRLTCLAYGACFDGDGRHPVGTMTIGAVSGEPFIAWADGRIQHPPPPEGKP